ncbi:unnamed protein product [Cuscuta campestris]|uniref:Uncharacterized protein n=1 Tax=Cuscuta campestris TaxID=132261 RepID=A0A484MT05_9ASTE|nr:unnamed protein product [Cuscuta campestris]
METSLALWILKLFWALVWFQKTCTELIWKAYILSKKQGHSDVSAGIDDMDSSSPRSSPGDISIHETDGKVVRQLTKIIALNHIARENGDVPSGNEETSDHERLKKRLLQNGFVEHQIKGDGNCQGSGCTG